MEPIPDGLDKCQHCGMLVYSEDGICPSCGNAMYPEDEQNTMTYSIVRFHFKKESEVIKTGLSLEEAQEHCNREDTHGDSWFDGYRSE